MKKNQKLVFIMLLTTIAIEFGSLTKLSQVWNLAFTGQKEKEAKKEGSKVFGPKDSSKASVVPSVHPVYL